MPKISDQQVERQVLVHRAVRLEYFTIFYNIAEGVVSLILGGLASSIALIGFGLDSFVESFSGLVVLWRFRSEGTVQAKNALLEARAVRFVGWSFLLLAAYIAFESSRKLLMREIPDASVGGIVLAILSLIIMPALAYRKRVTGKALQSDALIADSKETLACSLLSLALLLGLSLNAWFHWWWADAAAGVVMIPWLLKEGSESLGGEGSSSE